MAGDGKWYLICYDIRDSRRLRQAAKKLEGSGRRMQYSIFRCWMTKTQVQQLRWELTELLEPEDDMLFIPLCEQCIKGLEVTHSSREKPDWPNAPDSFKII